ncbi:hypothetical protein [Mucilaginibacter sp. SJ]|uniref:hypothetical protein n=1 Tax=Mucilaginibacter sp. SJ TaxID=3029053 RepID=UPI0023A9FB08|nr:hypothetical protein [Mucilaginibacter sp. SJ]WEA01708.1 hypothetical protein MusilaSJ_02080 [Mucilaginibacter sp. SJ]
MEFKIGQKYEVDCAVLEWKEDGIIYYVPVFDHLHADPQFGFEYEHYHIDGRFEMHPRVRHWFNIKYGYTLTVIVKHDMGSYNFKGIIQQSLKCEWERTGLLFIKQPKEKQRENLKSYETWYESFVGRSCKGRRCPHYGTEMLENNGQLVCPMHHLTADLLTEKVMPFQSISLSALD